MSGIAETRGSVGRIAVYGATGYTGRLVAAELAAAGADFVLAGRNREKLDALAAEVGGSAAVAAVPLDDAAGLRALLEDSAAVIACAGPFSVHGEPVLRAAAETGTHYLDTTGEQGFMRRVFDEFGPIASKSGAALVTGMGFDYVPGDMIASLTANGMGQIDELSLNYAVAGFGPSRGTARTALGQIAGEDVQWLEGEYVPADSSISRGKFDFGGEIGVQRMTRYPAGEHITVPRHVDTRTVRTALTASTTSPVAIGAPLLMTGLSVALKTPARRALDVVVNRLPEGPPEARRRAARFTIVCEARAGSRRRRGVIRGEDVYGMTARSITAGALRCVAPGFAGSGALAPSQAFDPAGFLPELAEFGVKYEVTAT
ncbi:MAG: saccharopine dehydrogenase NADP-binding domain-containing protein [Actinomycetota bacterium]|nr:saccharopine dehydrogenase NADP-binding domain-containing protein [Actinomycetota bacterium]